MKKTRKIRLLAFILTLCLTIGALPLYVFADGTEAELPEQITETTNENLTAFQLGLGEKSVAELENMTLSAADIPASISRETVEAKDHVLRLREQEADLNTVIFQNRDGGKTVYLFGSPVKYVDANGNIRDKSTTLVSENVTVNGKIYAHSATDNFFGQYYPTMPQNGVMLAFGPYTVEMKPVITGVLTLRDTVVADNKVTYNKVFGTGTSLVYTPTLNGVKEDIILQTYTGKSSFSFTLKTNGLAIIQDENDTFLADFEGKKVASLGDVIITDKVGKTTYGTMTVVTKIEREEYTVTVNAPIAFLTNPTTVYPVTVDPTVVINQQFKTGELDDYGNAQYGTAIEDLCIYDGPEDPYENGIAQIGNYYHSGESDAEPNISRILYRITETAVNTNNLSQYVTSTTLHSVRMRVYAKCYETSVSVAALPYVSSWSNGQSQYVSSLPAVTVDSEYYATTSIDDTSLQYVDIDITGAMSGYDDGDENISSLDFMLVVIGERGEDTECYNRASIYQTESEENNLYIVFDYGTLSGEYYINNKVTGHFLKGTSKNANVSTGSYVSDNSIKWRLVYAGEGKYYIVSKNVTGAYAYGSGEAMKIGTMTDATDNKYKWIISADYYGEGNIINALSTNYLYGGTNDTTILYSYTSNNAMWRLCKVSDYVNLTSFSVTDIVMDVGETVTPTITIYPENATWANAGDFTWSSSNTTVVTVSDFGEITSVSKGKVELVITHNLSGASTNLTIDVCSEKLFIRIFSFDDNDLVATSGHSFIGLHNDTPNCISLFNLTINPGEYITIGTWSTASLDQETFGVWVNMELHEINDVTKFFYDRRVSLVHEFSSQNEIENAMRRIEEHIQSNDTWNLINNCSSFAIGLWNYVTGDAISLSVINTPRKLKDAIIARGDYETCSEIGEYSYRSCFLKQLNLFTNVE